MASLGYKYCYGTAQFKLNIRMCVLVQLLEEFIIELANFLQVHLWHAFNPCDKPYSYEMHSGEVFYS